MESILIGKRSLVLALGCRTNICEAEAISSMLASRGCICVDSAPADAVVVVTCAITATADAKSRKIIRRARRESPGAAIAVCGCWAQNADADAAREIGADILIGNRRKHVIADELERWFSSRQRDDRDLIVNRNDDIEHDRTWDGLQLERPTSRTRAFMKIQDGCSRSCSYCIVPSSRGAQVSRDPADVIAEAERVASHGCREVVLTGVHLGSYRTQSATLGELVRRIASVRGVERVRLGSIEPFAVTDELLDALAGCGVSCPHLHIPIQSGDDGVLAAMRRGYTSDDIARIISRVREKLGRDVHISTDLMVGFPGESDEAFARSLDLISELELGRVHVFPYSPRPGTDAAEMAGAVPDDVVSARTDRALALAEELLESYASRFIGRERSVLVERAEGGDWIGWTENYLAARGKILPDARENLIGSIITFTPRSLVGGILLDDGADASLEKTSS